MLGWEVADETIVEEILASGAFLVGLCGAQGSGKSTTAARWARALEVRGKRTVVLSLDDFYLTKVQRAALAQDIHPLLAVRGVPGTHDVGLAMRTLTALKAGETVRLPHFDKATDDRTGWSEAGGRPDVVIFEGWCVGATPQLGATLAVPVNALEAEADAEGRWRTHVNDRLAGDYAALFAMLDLSIALKAPGFDCVLGWRAEQEAGISGPAVMDRATLGRFIACFERITRHLLDDPNADLLIELDERRAPVGIERRG